MIDFKKLTSNTVVPQKTLFQDDENGLVLGVITSTAVHVTSYDDVNGGFADDRLYNRYGDMIGHTITPLKDGETLYDYTDGVLAKEREMYVS